MSSEINQLPIDIKWSLLIELTQTRGLEKNLEIKHHVNQSTCNTDVKPDWQSDFRNFAVFASTHRPPAVQGDHPQRKYHRCKNDVRKQDKEIECLPFTGIVGRTTFEPVINGISNQEKS